MALIDNLAVVYFVERRLRNRAQILRDLLDLLQDDHLEYWQTVNGMLAGFLDGDTVDDQNRGFKPVTKADIVTMKAREDQLLAVLEAVGAMEVVQRFVLDPPGQPGV